jgi:spoIIIJ-associated protein
LQHIARLLAIKKTEERFNFIVDVNSYRQEKNGSIGKMAREMAEQALQERRAVVLRPMTPYERRIVHLELANNSDIKTESIGEGEERRVVIKPADLI